jgi:hypothetical protein
VGGGSRLTRSTGKYLPNFVLNQSTLRAPRCRPCRFQTRRVSLAFTRFEGHKWFLNSFEIRESTSTGSTSDAVGSRVDSKSSSYISMIHNIRGHTIVLPVWLPLTSNPSPSPSANPSPYLALASPLAPVLTLGPWDAPPLNSTCLSFKQCIFC